MARTDRTPRRRLTESQRRVEILGAASVIFMQKGYSGASLSQIAARAGASEALLVRYFGTKSALYLEIWRQRLDQLFAAQLATDENLDPHLTQRERLEIGMRSFLDFVSAQPQAWSQQFLAPRGEPAEASEFRHEWRAAYIRLLRERADLPDTQEVAFALAGFLGLNDALCLEWVMNDCPPDKRNVIVTMSSNALSALLDVGLNRTAAQERR